MPADRPPLRFTRHAADQALARGFRLSVLDMMQEVDAGRFEEDRPIGGRHSADTRHILLDAGPVLVVEGDTVVTVIRPPVRTPESVAATMIERGTPYAAVARATGLPLAVVAAMGQSTPGARARKARAVRGPKTAAPALPSA